MSATIKRQDSAQEYYFAEGCFITEISNSDDDPSLSIARARVEPGGTTRWHRLADSFERYVILAGQGRVEIGELEAQPVYPGDVVLIPPRCRQRIHNPGPDDLLFLALCSPRFTEAVYEDIDDAAR